MGMQEQLGVRGIPQLHRQATEQVVCVHVQQKQWKDGVQGEAELLQSDSGGWVAGGTS